MVSPDADIPELEEIEDLDVNPDEVVPDDASIDKIDSEEGDFEEEVDDERQSNTLLEDASELGDDDDVDVINLQEDEEESH
jgi:hypothetical protein